MADIVHATDETFEAEVLGSDMPVMVDFWAPWCGPCKLLGPIVEELAEEYDGRIKVVKMNTDENSAVPSQYPIQGIPTLIFFKDGQPLGMVVGFRSKEDLRAIIEQKVLLQQ